MERLLININFELSPKSKRKMDNICRCNFRREEHVCGWGHLSLVEYWVRVQSNSYP